MKKVLLVEDSKIIANAISIILKAEKIEVFHTEEGGKTLKIMNEKGIDLLILDLMMPGMNGYEVFDMIKKDKILSKVPVLILSAKVDALKWNKNIRTCDKFMAKPFENKELVKEVKKLLKI